MNSLLNYLNHPVRIARFAAVAVIPFLACPQAKAALLAYESFDYATGSQLRDQNGGTGFADVWYDDSSPGNEDTIAGGSLSYSGLTTAGNSLRMISPSDTLSGNDIRPMDPVPGTAGTSTWVSFLFALDGASAPLMSTSWGALTVFPSWDISYGPFFGIYDDPDGAPGDKVIGIGSTPLAPLALTDISFVPGQTYFLVAKINWNGDAAAETVSLYVNPTLGSAPTTPDAVTSDLYLAESGIFGGTNGLLGVAMFAGDEGTDWLFDEIRIGTTALDVMVAVPEPAGAGLVLLAGTLFWCRRYRVKACDW